MPILLAIPAAIGAYELALLGAAAIAAAFLASPAGQIAARQTIEGIENTIDDITIAPSTPPERKKKPSPKPITIPKTITLCPYQTKKNQKERCSEEGCQLARTKIDLQINSVRPVGVRGGLKGLKQRFCCQKYGAFGPEDARWRGEEIAIFSQQQGVRNGLAYVHRCNCYLPTKDYEEAIYYAEAPPPIHMEHMPMFAEYCMEQATLGVEG